jgi:hypothetical protein
LTLARHDVIADPSRTMARWCGYAAVTRHGSPRHSSGDPDADADADADATFEAIRTPL